MLTETVNATRNDIIQALHQASAATGSDFQFLLDTAMRESGLKTQAKSGSSSASGLFQFVSQTWLGLMKQNGTKYGLGSYADAISRESDGRYCVEDQSDRQAILALRNNPQVAALMEGEYVKQARNSLENSLGRSVCNGELYAAHFLGPESACRLIKLSEQRPQASAASAFPEAANANRSVFFHADGSAKSVKEVYDWALKQTDSSGSRRNSETQELGLPMRNATVASRASAYDGNWTAADLLPAAGAAVSLRSLGQAPFVVTPGVIDVLGSLSLPGDHSHSQGRNDLTI